LLGRSGRGQGPRPTGQRALDGGPRDIAGRRPEEIPKKYHHDLIPLALRMIWDTDGVVDVVNRLGETQEAKQATTA
jgi:hypothetical protein